MNKKKNLKPVPEGNKGLTKLPEPVRNQIGFLKKGGVVKMQNGGSIQVSGKNFSGIY
tara:strand:- start:29 stop:199 length:171 start_codon:yes stop_codon:yes gene_type:complete